MHPQLKSLTLVSLVILSIPLMAFPQAKAVDRIAQTIDSRNTIQLQGNVHSFLQNAADQGRMDGGARLEGVSLVFKRTAAQDAALEKLLAEQQDPHSANYHKWLTPEQFADRFGLSANDVNKVTAWLVSEGFTINRVSRARTAVFFTGTVAQIETVFRTEMHQFLVKGESHYANAVEPAIPAALAEVAMGLTRLDNFRPKARVQNHMSSARLRANYLLNGQNVLAPEDFAKIYDIPSTLAGTGQSIAIVGQSAIFSTGSGASTAYPDIDAFRTAFKLPARTASNFSVALVPNTGSNPGVLLGDVDESNLDLEWSAAVAPSANIIFLFAGTTGSAFDAIVDAIDNKVAPIISSSYGLCEQSFTTAQIQALTLAGQQANAQGQTLVAASGDQGPADCDTSTGLPGQGGMAVDLPAGLPYTTGVGGTEFSGDVSNPSQYWNATNDANNGSVKGYIPETTWNDTTMVNSLDATGGGASTVFSKPSWQTGTGVPNDGARDVPDVALAASNEHDPYVFCTRPTAPATNPNCNALAGGTSFGAPTFAGIVALLNQKISATTGQGNVNPTLYSVASSTSTAFHDVTTGNNIVPCGSATPNCPTSGTLQYGFSAGTGYDQVTGLGTLDVTVLANAWGNANPTAADFHMFGSITSISAPGGSGTSVITVDGANGFSGSVALTCLAPATALIACSLNPSSVTPTGTKNTASSTLTITTKAAASLRPQSAPLWLSGGGTMLAAAFVLGIPGRRRKWKAAAALMVLALLAAAVGCGGSSSGGGTKSGGTPAGTYVITVTGSSGGTSHSTNVSVSVI